MIPTRTPFVVCTCEELIVDVAKPSLNLRYHNIARRHRAAVTYYGLLVLCFCKFVYSFVHQLC